MNWYLKFLGHMLWKGTIHLLLLIVATLLLMWVVSSVFLIGPVGALEHWSEGGSIWWFILIYCLPWTVILILWLNQQYGIWAAEQRRRIKNARR